MDKNQKTLPPIPRDSSRQSHNKLAKRLYKNNSMKKLSNTAEFSYLRSINPDSSILAGGNLSRSNSSKNFLIPSVSLKRNKDLDMSQRSLQITHGKVLLSSPKNQEPAFLHYKGDLKSQLQKSSTKALFKKITRHDGINEKKIIPDELLGCSSDHDESKLQKYEGAFNSGSNSPKNSLSKGAKILKGLKNQSSKINQDDQPLTPNDFIQLIQEDGSITNEFCYLKKMNHAYDLRIVEFQAATSSNISNPNRAMTPSMFSPNDEYITISSRGVSYFSQQNSRFVPLDRWKKEAFYFNKLMKLEFFSKYRLFKNFAKWKKHIRKTAMKSTTDKLRNELMIGDRFLRRSLLGIKDSCFVMQSDTNYCKFDECENVMQFSGFKTCQQQFIQNDFQKRILQIEQDIKNNLINNMSDSMREFKEQNKISTSNESKGIPLLIGDQKNLDMPYTKEATLRIQQEKFKKFLKLVEFMIVDSKIKMMSESTQKTVRKIQQQNEAYEKQVMDQKYKFNFKGKQYINCSVKISIDQQTIQLKPTREDLNYMFEEIVNRAIVKLCRNHKRIINDDQILQIIYDSNDKIVKEPETNILKVIIMSDDRQEKIVASLNQSINTTYSYLEVYSNRFQNLVQMYFDNLNKLNAIDTYQAKDHQVIKLSLEKWKQQLTEINSLSQEHEAAIFLLDFHQFKNNAIRCVSECLDKMKRMMPEIYLSTTKQLITQILACQEKMKIKPVQIEDFIEFQKNKTEIAAKMDAYADQLSEISCMWINIKDNCSSSQVANIVKQQQEQQLGKPQHKLNLLRTLLQEAQMNTKTYETNAQQLLKNKIPQIKDEIYKLYNNKIKTSKLQANSTIDQVSEVIEQYQAIHDRITHTIKQIKQFQQQLSMEEYNEETMPKFSAYFNNYKKIWKLHQTLKTYQQQIMFQPWTTIDIEHAKKQVESFINDASKLEKHIKTHSADDEEFKVQRSDTNVLYDVLIEAKKLKPLIETVECLRDKSLLEKEWKQIRTYFEKINKQKSCHIIDFDNKQATIKDIYDYEISEELDFIQSVVYRSKKQMEIQNKISSVNRFWSEKATDSSVKILAENFEILKWWDIIMEIDEKITLINGISEESEVQAQQIKQTIISNKNMFDALRSFMTLWEVHQSYMFYFKPIFQNPYWKSNPKEHKLYSQPCGQWNKLIKQGKESTIKKWATSQKNIKIIKDNIEQLEQLKKSVEDFLNVKRQIFPKFFFLSNEELLHVLQSDKEIRSIEDHIGKVFTCVKSLEQKELHHILVSTSTQSITVKFSKAISNYEVEQIFKLLEEGIMAVVRSNIKNCLASFEKEDFNKKKWIKDYLLQSLLFIQNSQYTKIIEEDYMDPVQTEDLSQYLIYQNSQIKELQTFLKENTNDAEFSVGKLQTLIIQELLHRQITQMLLKNQIIEKDSFEWQSQIRCYHQNYGVNAENFHTKFLVSEVEYGFEFVNIQGAYPYMMFSEKEAIELAMALKLKHAPVIKGRTHIIENFSKFNAKYYHSVLCDQNLSEKYIKNVCFGTYLEGCFVEFRQAQKLKPHQISIIANFLKQVHSIFLRNQKNFNFGWKKSQINVETINTGVIFRLSDTSSPQDFTRILPFNHKSLQFKTMPYALYINLMMEIRKKNFKNISSKFMKFVDLIHDVEGIQIFTFEHVRNLIKEQKITQNLEAYFVKQMLEIVSKHLASQKKISFYKQILIDIFFEDKALHQQMRESISHAHKGAKDKFEFKYVVNSLVQTTEKKSICVIAGPTQSGKISVIFEAYKQRVSRGSDFQALNIDILSEDALFGCHSNELWKQGILISKIKKLPLSKEEWFVFEGSYSKKTLDMIDRLNHNQLQLSNGQIVFLSKKWKFIFSIYNLDENAINLPKSVDVIQSNNFINIKDSIQLMAEKRIKPHFEKDSQNRNLQNFGILYNKCGSRDLNKDLKSLGIKSEYLRPQNVLRYFINTLDAILATVPYEIKLHKEFSKGIENIFIWVLYWCVGSSLPFQSAGKYEKTLIDNNNKSDIQYSQKLGLIRLEFDTPAGTLKKINDPEIKIIKNQIYVATVDLRAKAHFIELMIKSNYPVVLIGKAGSGKSKYMDYLQAFLNPQIYTYLPIKMRRSMSYEEFKDILFSKTRISFKTVQKKCFCSSTSKKLIIFIDDFNIQDINSRIFQFIMACIKDGYYYDAATNEKIFIFNISFVVAQNDAYECRIDNKFMKYFKPIYINEIELKDISQIYQNNVHDNLYLRDIFDKCVSLHSQVKNIQSNGQIVRKFPFSNLNAIRIMQSIKDYAERYQLLITEDKQNKQNLAKLWAYTSNLQYTSYELKPQAQQKIKKQIMNFLNLIIENCNGKAKPLPNIPDILTDLASKNSLIKADGHYEDYYEYLCFLMQMSQPRHLLTIGQPLPESIKAEILQEVAKINSLKFSYVRNKSELKKIDFKKCLIYISTQDSSQLLQMLGFVANNAECRHGRYVIDCSSQSQFLQLIKNVPQICSMFHLFSKQISHSRSLISSEQKEWLVKLEVALGEKLCQRQQISIISNLFLNEKKIRKQISNKKGIACKFVQKYAKLILTIEENVKKLQEINQTIKELHQRDEYLSVHKKQINEALNAMKNSSKLEDQAAQEERIQNKKKLQDQLSQLDGEVIEIKQKRKKLDNTIIEIESSNRLSKQVLPKLSVLNSEFEQLKSRIQHIQNSEHSVIFCLSLYYFGIKEKNQKYIDFVERQDQLNVINIDHILKVVYDINPSDIRQQILVWVLQDKKIIVKDHSNRFLRSIKKAVPKIRILNEPHSLNNLFNQPIIYTGKYIDSVPSLIGSSNPTSFLAGSSLNQSSLGSTLPATQTAASNANTAPLHTVVPAVLSSPQLTIITKEDPEQILEQLKDRTFLTMPNSNHNERETIKQIFYSQKQKQILYQIIAIESQIQDTFLNVNDQQERCINTFIDPNQKDLKKVKPLVYNQSDRLKGLQQNLKNLQTGLTIKYEDIVDFCCLMKKVLKSIKQNVSFFEFSDKKFEDLILVSMGVKPSGQKTYRKIENGLPSKMSLGRSKTRKQIPVQTIESKVIIESAESSDPINIIQTQEEQKEIPQQPKQEQVEQSQEKFFELFKKRMTNEMLSKIMISLNSEDSLTAYIIFAYFMNEQHLRGPSYHRQALVQIAKKHKMGIQNLSELQDSVKTIVSQIPVNSESSLHLKNVAQSLENIYSAYQQDSNTIIRRLIQFGDVSLNKVFENLLLQKYSVQILDQRQNIVILSNLRQNPFFIIEKYILNEIEENTWCYLLESQPNSEKIVQMAEKFSLSTFVIINNKNPNAFQQLKEHKHLKFIFLYPDESEYFELRRNSPSKIIPQVEELTMVYAEDSTFIHKNISQMFIKSFSKLQIQKPELQQLARIPFYEDATEFLKNIYKTKIHNVSQQFYNTKMLNEIVTNMKNLSFNQLIKMLVKICYPNQKEKQFVVIKQAKKIISKKQNLISTFVEFLSKDYSGFEDVVFEGASFIGQNGKTLLDNFSLGDPQQIINMLVPQLFRKKYPIDHLYFAEKNTKNQQSSDNSVMTLFVQQKLAEEIDKILNQISTNIVLESQNTKKNKHFYKELIKEQIKSRIYRLKKVEEHLKKYKKLLQPPVKILTLATLQELKSLQHFILSKQVSEKSNLCGKSFAQMVLEYANLEMKSIEYLDKLYASKQNQRVFDPSHFREPIKFLKYFLYEMNPQVNFRNGEIQARFLTEKDKEAHFDTPEQCKSLLISQITVKNGKFDHNKNTLEPNDKQETSKIPNVHLCFNDREMTNLNSTFPVYFNGQKLFQLSIISKVKEDSVWKDKLTLEIDSK